MNKCEYFFKIMNINWQIDICNQIFILFSYKSTDNYDTILLLFM